MESRQSLTASDGVDLTYWVTRAAAPRGRLVLFLHGAASNHTRWSELVERTTLGRSWDLLRPDLRGNGQSMARGRLDLAVWTRDLLEILRREGDPGALLVGHSLGAQIALAFAAAHPARTAGLVLIDPVFPSALTGRRRLLLRLAPLFRILVGALRALGALGLGRRRFPDRDLRRLDEETRRALRQSVSKREIARRYGALGPILRHQPLANYLQQLLATVAPLPPLEGIEAPTLLLASVGITFADADRAAAEADHLPRAERIGIDANHWPLTEKPDEVRRAIEGWVERTFPERPDLRV